MSLTIEQRIKIMLGERDFALAALETQLEQAQARIAELEKSSEPKPDLHVVEN